MAEVAIKCKKQKEEITFTVLTARRMKQVMSICPICDGPMGGGCDLRSANNQDARSLFQRRDYAGMVSALRK